MIGISTLCFFCLLVIVGCCFEMDCLKYMDDKDKVGIMIGLIVCYFLIMFVLFIFSELGLNVYIWQFNYTFTAKSIDNSIVYIQPTYIKGVEALIRISKAFGVYSCILPALHSIADFIDKDAE